MKKILTLLLVAGAFTAAQAQTSREEARRVILGGGSGNGSNGGNRDVILGGGSNGDSYPTYPGNYPSGSRQAEIDCINRDYDNKIQSIRNNGYLSNGEKDRAIRQLERDRQARIKQVNGSYNRNRDRDDDDDDRYENRRNNGKHKGWNKKQKNKNWKKGNRDRDWDDD